MVMDVVVTGKPKIRNEFLYIASYFDMYPYRHLSSLKIRAG